MSEFQAALDALQVSPLPGQYREVVSSHLKEADSKVKDKINVVVTSALGADKPSTDNATKDTVLALEDYINATKEVATIMSDKNIQKKIIDAAHEVLSRSGDMFLEAQNVLKTPGNEANARSLQDTARHVASVMKELEKTYIFGAPGQEQTPQPKPSFAQGRERREKETQLFDSTLLMSTSGERPPAF